MQITRRLRKVLAGKKNPKWKIGKLQEAATEDYVAHFADAEYELYRTELKLAKRYGEYGVGASTVFVSENFECEIQGAETDEAWAAQVSKLAPGARVIHIDLGPVGKFGRPSGYSKVENFSSYFEAPFKDGFSPDLVLIDGRFRVACFLRALKLSRPGTVILFDDYPFRERYHIVEQLVKPSMVSHRMARFQKAVDMDIEKLEYLESKFEFVMD